MNKIKEKVLEEIAERFKELNKNSQNVVDFLLRVDREIPKFVEKAIKLTAKEILESLEAGIKDWNAITIPKVVLLNTIKDLKKSFGVEK